jgi:hypothetical protein
MCWRMKKSILIELHYMYTFLKFIPVQYFFELRLLH